MKLGLIGGGYWGQNLIRDFYKLGVLDIVCDLDVGQLEKYRILYPNLRTTTQWRDLLENEAISAICIALPAVMHFQYAKDTMEHGKDVMVEKPMALSVRECDELIRVSKATGRILMVGHLLQYHPAFEKIGWMIANDYIGDIKFIKSNRLNLGKVRTEENVLWSFAPHDISVILKLMGGKMPDWLVCHGEAFLSKERKDITNTIMKFNLGTEKECYVEINVNWLNPYKEQRMTIVGTKGMITFDDINKELKYHPEYIAWNRGVPVANKREFENIEYDKTVSPLECECQHFIQICENRDISALRTSGEEGRRVLAILEMAEKSMSEDKSIMLNQKHGFGIEKHPTAIIEDGAEIGEGTKIWHFSHLMRCCIGKNCNIGQNVFIGNGVVVGDGCKIQNNVSLYDGVVAEDNVFFGPSCVLTNDKNPRCEYSKGGQYLPTYLERGCTLGANSTILCGIRIGKYAMIGAGAVVVKNVEPYSVMVGNPAKKIGEIDERGNTKKSIPVLPNNFF